MNASELREILEGELAAFPERASGEEGYRFLVRITKSYADTARQALVEVLGEWLQLRAEPKTMLAVKLSVDHHLGELRTEIEALLEDVKDGSAFNPALRGYYARRITDSLSRI
jgi:hypothetical protein